MKILFFDLDDTLLHSDKTISEYTLKTLNECQTRGLLVAFATSRGQMRKSPFVEQVQPDIIVANGGASVIYKGNTIFSESFTLEETRLMLAKAYEVCVISYKAPVKACMCAQKNHYKRNNKYNPRYGKFVR